MDKQVKILLVDDVQAITIFAQSVLNSLGFGFVDSAMNASEALDKITSHKPDVVFLDAELPDLDGQGLLNKIRALSPATKVVICSAQSTEENVIRAVSDGAAGFLVKPITSINMGSVLSRIGQQSN